MLVRILQHYIAALILTLLLIPVVAFSYPVTDLYDGAEVVLDQFDSQRQQAILAALKKVLLRVTGDEAILSQAFVEPMLAQPELYVSAYRYEPTSDTNTFNLQIKFDALAINRLLRQQNQAVWGADRPLVLVWLAIDNGQLKDIVSSESETFAEVAVAIQKAAQMHGLPVLLPLLDMDDRMQVSVNDVWGPYPDVIRRASLRYQADLQLIARAYRNNKQQWQLDWSSISAFEKQHWQTNAPELNDAINAGLNQLTRQIAAHFISNPDPERPDRVQLTVSGIGEQYDFAAVASYLNSLTPVAAVDLLSAGPQAITFELKLSSSESALVEVLAVGHKLEALNVVEGETLPEHLYYRLIE